MRVLSDLNCSSYKSLIWPPLFFICVTHLTYIFLHVCDLSDLNCSSYASPIWLTLFFTYVSFAPSLLFNWLTLFFTFVCHYSSFDLHCSSCTFANPLPLSSNSMFPMCKMAINDRQMSRWVSSVIPRMLIAFCQRRNKIRWKKTDTRRPVSRGSDLGGRIHSDLSRASVSRDSVVGG